jgi:hypothetical protein
MSAAKVVMEARASGIQLGFKGDDLLLVASAPPPAAVIDMLRAHKPEIIELLHAERRAVLRHIANHFQSSPPGQCADCGGDRRADDPFVTIFVGDDRADVHASCHPKWFARQESKARAVLAAMGIAPVSKFPDDFGKNGDP